MAKQNKATVHVSSLNSKKIMPSSPNARAQEYLLSAPILKHIVGNLDIILQSTVMFQYFNILHIRR